MEKIVARLLTPADDSGERKDVHFITDADAVVLPGGGTLAEKLDDLGNGSVIADQEMQPDRACIWYQVKSTEPA